MRQSWDDYFLSLASIVATRSKDPRTKVGAVIVKNNRVLSTGYNGAPKNFPDEEVPTSSDTTLPLKDQKYSYICHAELNAILNYNANRDLDGATIYTTITPCHECAKLIAQSGITRAVYSKRYHRTEEVELSEYIMDKCGVQHELMEEKDEI